MYSGVAGIKSKSSRGNKLELELLYDQQTIKNKIIELAKKIDQDFRDNKHPLVLVGVLKGAFIFLADLARQLQTPHTIDFIAVSSYGDRGSDQGEVKILLDTRQDLRDKNVIIVEDITDSGRTLSVLSKIFAAKGANQVKVCCLLKRGGRESAVNIDYCGFVVPQQEWLVGYGLDYQEENRTLNEIYSMKKPV